MTDAIPASVIRKNNYGLYVVAGEDGKQHSFTEELLPGYTQPGFQGLGIGDHVSIVIGSDGKVAEVISR